MHRLVFALSAPLVVSGLASQAADPPVPVVFKVSEGVRPNSIVSLYGEYLTGSPSVRFLRTDGSLAATQSSVQADPDGHFCRVVIPSNRAGAYRLSVGNDAGWSTHAVYVNRAEPRWISDEQAYPGLQLKLIGRNLGGGELNNLNCMKKPRAPINAAAMVMAGPGNPVGNSTPQICAT